MAKEEIPARERLLHVATLLFTEHGFEGTPVSRIVREAGVTMPVLYYHFGSKSGLLGAVIGSKGNWLRSDVTLDPQAQYEMSFRRLVAHALEQLDEIRDGLRLRLLLAFESGSDADEFRDVVRQQRQKSIKHLAGLMAGILPTASPRRNIWLSEVYLSGVQSLALEIIGANSGERFLQAKAENLIQTLKLAAEMPDELLPNCDQPSILQENENG
jgi:AcrR family transcriptional regulator